MYFYFPPPQFLKCTVFFGSRFIVQNKPIHYVFWVNKTLIGSVSFLSPLSPTKTQFRFHLSYYMQEARKRRYTTRKMWEKLTQFASSF